MSDIISLQARLDGVALKTLSSDLTRASAQKSVRIDAGEVTHMSALAAQLILAASRAVHSDGGTFEFVALSERAGDQLTTMGLSPDKLSEGAI